jgi:hypothetical protein
MDDTRVDLDLTQPDGDEEKLEKYGAWLGEFQDKNGREPTAAEIAPWSEQTK